MVTMVTEMDRKSEQFNLTKPLAKETSKVGIEKNDNKEQSDTNNDKENIPNNASSIVEDLTKKEQEIETLRHELDHIRGQLQMEAMKLIVSDSENSKLIMNWEVAVKQLDQYEVETRQLIQRSERYQIIIMELKKELEEVKASSAKMSETNQKEIQTSRKDLEQEREKRMKLESKHEQFAKEFETMTKRLREHEKEVKQRKRTFSDCHPKNDFVKFWTRIRTIKIEEFDIFDKSNLSNLLPYASAAALGITIILSCGLARRSTK